MDLFGQGLFEPDGRKRSKTPPGYIPLFDDALLADEPVEQDAVTPEERDSVLAEIGALTGGTLSRVGDLLAMPGDYARGLLSGRYGERVTGRELNRMAGLAGPEDNWGNWAVGLGTEFITDPLALLTGPMKALTPAGKAAAKLAGPVGSLLDTAPTAMTRKAISEGWLAKPVAGATTVTPALPMVAERTKKALKATKRTISTFDPATVGRPLYGTRTARRAGTLDDLIKYADDQDAAETAARNLLGGDLDKLRHQPLSKSFGIGLPFGDPIVVGDLLGKGFGDTYADVLDTLGQAYRWSPVGRGMAALFDGKVGGALDAEQQITNRANYQSSKAAGANEWADHLAPMARVQIAHPEVFSPDGNQALGRYLEGPAVRTADDIAYVESRPQLKAYADWVDTKRGDMLTESQAAGLNAAPLQDKYGLLWVPRRAEPALEMASRRNRKLGAALSAFTTDALRRTDAMSVPGGRTTIMKLSQDANISGAKRLLTKDAEAAKYVFDKLNAMVQTGQPKITMKKAERIARIMHELPQEVTEKAPLFGQHPTEMFGDAVRNKGEAIGTTKTLYDSLATFAVNQPYNAVEGGRHVSLQTALNALGLKTYDAFPDALDDVFDDARRSLNPEIGAAQQMRERLAKLTGRDADEINLNEFSIPKEHVDRLTKARDLYTSGEAAQSLLDHLDHYTAAWRGGILGWPARSVRDLYSGATGNWLVGAFDAASTRAAYGLMMEGPDSAAFQSVLRRIPKYSTDDGLAQFYADIGRADLMGGNINMDVGASVRGARALDALPGSDPITLASIGRELGSGWTWKNFWNWRSNLKPLAETTNPILRAGERANALTDGINRLTGYLSLLQQGYEPVAAAAVMKRMHADFRDMSAFEKTILRRLFPWYSYQSQIFREVLRQLSERPGGRYGQLIKATESLQDEGDDNTYIPSDLRSQFAFPIPAEFGGNPSPGTQTYLKDLDFPGFDQINMIETPGTLGGAVQGTARQIAMQAHPLARQMVELAFGQDLYTRQPLSSSTSALDSALRYATGDQSADVPAVIDKTVENLPFLGRPLGVVRSMTDNRGGQSLGHRAAKTMINSLSGIKTQDVDQQRVLGDAIRQISESIDPFTREFKQVYIPEQLQPRVPQWALQRLAVERALERELRELRKPKDSKDKKGRKKKRKAGEPMSLFE